LSEDFNRLLDAVRIDRAKFLLKNHRQKIDKVATGFGYHDAAYSVAYLNDTSIKRPPLIASEPRFMVKCNIYSIVLRSTCLY